MLRPSISSLRRAMAAGPAIRRRTTATSAEPARIANNLIPNASGESFSVSPTNTVGKQRSRHGGQRDAGDGLNSRGSTMRRQVDGKRRGHGLQHERKEKVGRLHVEPERKTGRAKECRHDKHRPHSRRANNSGPSYMAAQGHRIDAHEGDAQQHEDCLGEKQLDQGPNRRCRDADEHERRDRSRALAAKPRKNRRRCIENDHARGCMLLSSQSPM